MSHLIKKVAAKPNFIILATFIGGDQKEFDLSKIEEKFHQFHELRENETLFSSVKVDAGGYGISWNDDLDLDAETIWEEGKTVFVERIDPSERLAAELARVRAYADLTQKELSQKTGIYQSDISKYEHAQGNPSFQTLIRLAEGVGMDLEIRFVPKSKI